MTELKLLSYDELKAQPLDVKVGDTVYLDTDFANGEARKHHVMYVLDGYHTGSGEKLIITRTYGHTRQWWHQFMFRDFEFKSARDRAKQHLKD